MSVTILPGNCLEQLPTLPRKSVNCVVTSPPYWGLRNYGTLPQVWGGKRKCEHVFTGAGKIHKGGAHGAGVLLEGGRSVVEAQAEMKDYSCGEFCSRCHAWRGELGHEPTVALYIRHPVSVFAAVHRVLADDGTCWVNMGQCYAGSGWSGGTRAAEERGELVHRGRREAGRTRSAMHGARIGSLHGEPGHTSGQPTTDYYKPKDLIPQAWLLGIALQKWGWWLRSDIIWEKPACMPESTKDRPTVSHEYFLLLSKSARYYYDADAIREPSSPESHARYARGRSNHHKHVDGAPGQSPQTIALGFEHMRKPGVNPKAQMELGPKYGAPESSGMKAASGIAHTAGWRERSKQDQMADEQTGTRGDRTKGFNERYRRSKQNASFSAAVGDLVEYRNKRTVWSIPSEPFKGAHFATFPKNLVRPAILAGCPLNGTVLDPFGGSGTTGEVAEEEGRNAILIELQPDYVKIAKKRTGQTGLLHAL